MRLDILQEIVKSNGDSYTSLAKKLGITTASVSHKMNGQNPWKLDEIKKLMGIYGLSASDIEAIFL